MTTSRKPRGRPPADPYGESATERFEMRLTPRHKDKLDKLGGAEWVRGKIIQAKPPKEDEPEPG